MTDTIKPLWEQLRDLEWKVGGAAAKWTSPRVTPEEKATAIAEWKAARKEWEDFQDAHAEDLKK